MLNKVKYQITKKIELIGILLFISCSIVFPQHSKESALQKMFLRQNLVVTEVEKDLYKIENKLTRDTFFEDLSEGIKYNANENIDSMVIEIFAIDTSRYSGMYKHWLDIDISNFVYGLLINDFNSNGLIELYANRTIYNLPSRSPGIYELDPSGENFNQIFTYPDTVSIPKGYYDIDNDGLMEMLMRRRDDGLGGALFYKQSDFYSLPATPYFSFPQVENRQVNFPTFRDLDKNGKIDFAYETLGNTLYIAEFNPAITNFDSVYSFTSINSVGGITVGDFDMNGKTDIITSNVWGDVHLIETQGVHQYMNVWNGTVDIHNSYYSFSTNDIDKNGKPEFWVGGKHFTSGILLTCFETDGENSYKPVFKIKIPDYYTLNPLTTFADDIDGDGEEEIVICADYFLLVLKFTGSPVNHSYKIWYFNLRQFGTGETWTVKAYDINNDCKKELFFDTYTVKDSMGQTYVKSVNRLFKPNFTVGIDEQKENTTDKFYLYANYPNPFNPSTNIKFILKESVDVGIKVYNILGKEIKPLLEENLPAGEYKIQWNGKDNKGNLLPGGVYFIQMNAGEYRQTIKSILLK
ncbi:MAG TPA: FlgD immunoglobulin-like domain containing protein [Ignavibacteriaceae bacterium]|jgi:hypothetical protein|nr:FlgD immunoglobulin-like domain containing protein [Ignavibacteriaceae bacterium]